MRKVSHKKNVFVLLVAVCALAATGMAASVATANNGAVTTHFSAAYVDIIGGPLVCSGENIFKSGPKGFNKDSETCLILNGYPAGVYTFTWCSDSAPPSASAGLCTNNVTETVTSNGDGTSTSSIVAYY
jgi:hypothetical protein